MKQACDCYRRYPDSAWPIMGDDHRQAPLRHIRAIPYGPMPQCVVSNR